jgi:hypothetical protein
MGVMEIIGIAGSVSLLAGWRLYLCIFATGLAMRMNALPLPEHLASLDVLANPWVMCIAALAAIVEFLADKVMWLDTAWDAVHTIVRPIGGALLALAIIVRPIPVRRLSLFCSVAARALLLMQVKPAPAEWSTPVPSQSAMSPYRQRKMWRRSDFCMSLMNSRCWPAGSHCFCWP